MVYNFVQKLGFARISALLIIAALMLLLPILGASAQAQDGQDLEITKVLCNAIGLVTGGIGRAIAVLIIISLAVALFLGKVTWGLAIAVAVGLGVLFGAENIVGLLTNLEENQTICSNT